MRKMSLMSRIGLFGRAGIDTVAVLGRSAVFLFHALLGRGGIGGGFGLLVRQLHSVGVMSLVIIVVSGIFIGMVLALQGFSILSSYGSEQAVGQMVVELPGEEEDADKLLHYLKDNSIKFEEVN